MPCTNMYVIRIKCIVLLYVCMEGRVDNYFYVFMYVHTKYTLYKYINNIHTHNIKIYVALCKRRIFQNQTSISDLHISFISIYLRQASDGGGCNFFKHSPTCTH